MRSTRSEINTAITMAKYLLSPVLLRWRFAIWEAGGYCSFAYSALASFRMGMSGSALSTQAEGS
jgi:hypothetical protein